jgi:hypothetical protein
MICTSNLGFSFSHLCLFLKKSIIQTRPQDILDWVNQLRVRYGEGPIAVGMEQKRGSLLYALCQYDNLVLLVLNEIVSPPPKPS